eukprot:GHVS01035311.1.p1 GENE.GHVS01035311.1~~GHVS01035311.1.p1  ORF type:complete len:196 (-),score=51.93 GHVS01035311.1:620-1207(-)
METGYVPGGGVTYLAMGGGEFRQKVLKHVEETTKAEFEDGEGEELGDNEDMESELELQKAGASIVMNAMTSITSQIANNAGVNGDKVVHKIMNSDKPVGYGWNAKTNRFGDMIKMGVTDPAKVIISAIDHSASVAGLVLTTEGMLVEREPERTRKKGNRMQRVGGGEDDEGGEEADDVEEEPVESGDVGRPGAMM